MEFLLDIGAGTTYYMPSFIFGLAGEGSSIFRSLLISARSLKSSEFYSSLYVCTIFTEFALIMLISRFCTPLEFLTGIESGESSEFILMLLLIRLEETGSIRLLEVPDWSEVWKMFISSSLG